ncbi:MAG: Sensor protein [Myxococcales bacterium]|nr:Sensor protein [Myxococcales bacterium]
MLRTMPSPEPNLPFAAAWLCDNTVTPNERWRALCGDPGDCRWRPGVGGRADVPPSSLGRLLAGPDVPLAAIYTRDDGIVLEVHAAQAGADGERLAIVHEVSGLAVALHESSIDLLRERQRRALATFHLERALHDMNNHFHAIELRVSFLLLNDTREADENKLLQEIEQSGLNARRRIEGLGVNAGATPNTPRSAAVADAVALAAASMRRDSGRATVAAELAGLPKIAATPDELAVVFALLFDNAREAGGAAHVAGEVHDAEVVVTVSDDGSGIATEMLPKICKPFFTTKGEGHRGHGLALAVKLLHAAGAGLQIGNRDDGRGARVTLRFKQSLS